MNKRVYIYREASDFTDQLRTALATASMLASTIPALSKHGLSVTQHFLPDNDTQMLLVTELGHKSGCRSRSRVRGSPAR